MSSVTRSRVHRVGDVVPGLVVVGLIAAVAFSVAMVIDLSPLVAGIGLGALCTNLVDIPPVLSAGIAFAARSLLRIGIVVLGLRLSVGDLVSLGADGLAVVVVVVAVTFFGTQWLARRLRIAPELGLLVATGYSICGASAIAAMNGVVRADEEDVAYAITLVTICGTLSIFLLPPLAGILELDDAQFGTWVGGAVHDVGQVVATATHRGDAAVASATVVKLTRVVMLAPLVAAVAIRQRRRRATDRAPTAVPGDDFNPPLMPLFVLGFLAAIVVRSTGVLTEEATDAAAQLEKILFTLALVAMGLGVPIHRMRHIGTRPLVLGLLAWVLVAGTAYGGAMLVH